MGDKAAVIAYNFYEHKDPEQLLAEANAENVRVQLTEVKEGVSQTYDIGGEWVAVLYTPAGKKHAVTIRPVLRS
jgi:hypothetical protein